MNEGSQPFRLLVEYMFSNSKIEQKQGKFKNKFKKNNRVKEDNE